MSKDPFWTAIRQQLSELTQAKTADDVVRILDVERCPYRLKDPTWNGKASDAQGFFGGSGGDETVMESLEEAGWTLLWCQAAYWWAMEAPDGSVITYVEGDIYKGERR